MPPRMPDEILRRRSETTYRGAFQVRIKFIHDDERLCSFCALLDDPKGVAAMEQHRSHYRDVEFTKCRRQIVSIAIVHPRVGLQRGVTEPVGTLQLLHHDSTRAQYLF